MLTALAFKHWNVYDDRWVVKTMMPSGITDVWCRVRNGKRDEG